MTRIIFVIPWPYETPFEKIGKVEKEVSSLDLIMHEGDERPVRFVGEDYSYMSEMPEMEIIQETLKQILRFSKILPENYKEGLLRFANLLIFRYELLVKNRCGFI